MSADRAPSSDFVGSNQACRLLGDINRSTLTRWVQLGRITPAHQNPGRNGAMLFHRDDIEALAATLHGEAASA